MQSIVDKIIVLGRINYGEADRIATALGEKSGKITLMAKGVRKPKSKLAGGLEVFNINEVSYIPGKKDISTLVSSRLVSSHGNIVKDYEASQDVFGALKWLNDHLEQGTGADYYDLLAGMLFLAENSGTKANIWFFMRVFELSGHGLNPFHDENGQKLASSTSYEFDYDSLTFYPKEEGSFTQEEIKLLRLALSLGAPDFARITTTKAQTSNLNQVIVRCLQTNF